MESGFDPEVGEPSRPAESEIAGTPESTVPDASSEQAESPQPSASEAANAPFAPIEPPQAAAAATPFAPIEPTAPPSGPPAQQYPAQPYPAPWPTAGQPPANPFAYPPPGYGAPQAPTGTSGTAIAALVLGICGFLFITPIIGLIFGLIALSSIKRSGQRGRGLAVSGVVLSVVWIALFATLISIHIAIAPGTAKRDASGAVVHKGVVSVFDIQAKDCFTIPATLIGSTNNADARTFTLVPCSTPHDAEAIGSFTATETSSTYPGTEPLRTEGAAQCLGVLDSYLIDMGSVPAGTQIQYVYPNEAAWSGADVHRIECFLQFPSATMTQAVYRDKSSFTADQLRFLQAIHPLIAASTALNSGASTDLSTLQARAGDIATAANDEIAVLSAGPWPAAAQPAIDTLITKHRQLAQFMNQAMSATDEVSFGDDEQQAAAQFDNVDMQAARAALGLKSITPGSTS